MTAVLLVPVHLDALFVPPSGLAVAGPSADFSRLPHVGPDGDAHAEVPWLGESIAARPLQDQVTLGAGLHLHWALPDALCRATRAVGTERAGARATFPAVPDRWLVTKRWVEGGAPRSAQWVVESNYLHPGGSTPLVPTVTYPFPTRLDVTPDRAPGERPYRHLGRAVPLTDWRAVKPPPTAYLGEPLTALGYGAPTFAALYANCRSVFGFHDPSVRGGVAPEALSYELLGWYSDPAHDHLSVLASRPQQGVEGALAELGWAAPPGEGPTATGLPRMVCQARLEVAAPLDTPDPIARTAEVTLGNTTSEALSAYLAGALAASSPTAQELAEDQLEAVLLGSQLDDLHADLGAKLAEARHAQGFTTAPPAVSWTLRPARSDHDADSTRFRDSDVAPASEEARWPAGSGRLLDQLGTLQRSYDAAWDEIRHRRSQLASDWHKYMLCAHPPLGEVDTHPDPDELLRFIEAQELPALEALVYRTGALQTFVVEGVPVGSVPDVRVVEGSAPGSLAHRIVAAVEALHGVLVPPPLSTPTADMVPWAEILPRFLLQRQVAPRYFVPTEPVVLLAGSAIEVRNRHAKNRVGTGEPLAVRWTTVSDELSAALEAVAQQLQDSGAWERHTWTRPPWHPLLLEWEVELRPLAYVTPERSRDRRYDPDAVHRNFVLRRDEVDLVPRSGAPALTRHPRIYRGSSLLTPHGSDAYVEALSRELERDAAREPGQALSPQTSARLQAALAIARDQPLLAQSLSGFNEALLMNRQVLQLPIDDPLGFADERAVAARVRAALGEVAHRSPRPGDDFIPLRSGELRLTRLRLVDNFGRALDLDCEAMRFGAARTLPRRPGPAVMLPPRLMQPARLHFRWHAATAPALETNAHPLSSPVCGWMTPSPIDRCIFVHAADGEALGYLESEGGRAVWRSAPGRARPLVELATGIVDPTLRRCVLFLLARSGRYVDQLLLDLEAAQARIEPADAGDALLLGRPLALVRASLELQLRGPPVAHQGWRALALDLRGGGRTTDGFTKVRFPVRLGEQDQLGDGLAVYFVEDAAGAYDGYVIPSYQDVDGPEVPTDQRKCDFLHLAVDDPPLMVTLLMDPRGAVHATTGALPIKAIDIPPLYYSAALRKIELSFVAAPLLVDRVAEPTEVAVPVSSEREHAWTFLERDGAGFAPPLPVRTASLHTPFAAPVAIREGWLHLSRQPSNDGDKSR